MKESSETEGDGGRRDSLISDSERQSRKEPQEELPSRENRTARAKAPGQECAWRVRGTVERLDGWREGAGARQQRSQSGPLGTQMRALLLAVVRWSHRRAQSPEAPDLTQAPCDCV